MPCSQKVENKNADLLCRHIDTVAFMYWDKHNISCKNWFYTNPFMPILFQAPEGKPNDPSFVYGYMGCDLCNEPFGSMKDVREHYTTHKANLKDMRPFKCLWPDCEHDTWFKQRQHLRQHIYVHLGHKPFKCPYCNFSAVHRGALNTHIVNNHKT